MLSLLSMGVMCSQALPSPPDAKIHHSHSHPCPLHPNRNHHHHHLIIKIIIIITSSSKSSSSSPQHKNHHHHHLIIKITIIITSSSKSSSSSPHYQNHHHHHYCQVRAAPTQHPSAPRDITYIRQIFSPRSQSNKNISY